jgi:hypothetical protein
MAPAHSLFAVPKAFVGDARRIQLNAIRSWCKLQDVELLLLGDSPGVADVAATFGATHIPSIAVSDAGAPLVSDVFARAAGWAAARSLIYVNADILLPPETAAVIARVRRMLPTALCIGQCVNADVDADLDGWEADIARGAPLRGAGGIDYLAFVPSVFAEVPPFSLGRAYYDNWLLWHAYRAGVPIVDLTEVVPAIHQNHEYGHVAGGRSESYEGVDAQRNLALAGGRLHLFNIDDATHRMTPKGLRRNLLSPLRTFPPARWLALEPGRIRRSIEGLVTK